jgi:eukaryotic-like serine/threonine-protein kinase
MIPGYEIVDHIARSKVLDVYDVYSEARDCRCIAKMIRPDMDNERRRRRLRQEGRLLLSLAHPHIVRAYELIERPKPILILETLTGETLCHMIERSSRRLATDEVAFLGMHLCSALHYLHSQGYLHIDVKPSNVIAYNGSAKLLDLSIARPPGRAKRGVGTRQYMAPEQVRGATLTEATDVWGVGATLYEAATGEMPFPQNDQLERRATPIRALRPRLAPGVAGAIDAALEPEPANRPHMRELADALDGAVAA